jgi:hypothetical protein
MPELVRFLLLLDVLLVQIATLFRACSHQSYHPSGCLTAGHGTSSRHKLGTGPTDHPESRPNPFDLAFSNMMMLSDKVPSPPMFHAIIEKLGDIFMVMMLSALCRIQLNS